MKLGEYLKTADGTIAIADGESIPEVPGRLDVEPPSLATRARLLRHSRPGWDVPVFVRNNSLGSGEGDLDYSTCTERAGDLVTRGQFS